MLKNYIDFLRNTIDKLLHFSPEADISTYFEAVGLGFLTIFLVLLGIVALATAIILPVVAVRYIWKLITKDLVSKIDYAYSQSQFDYAAKLYHTYVVRKRIFIGVLIGLAVPFVLPLMLMFL